MIKEPKIINLEQALLLYSIIHTKISDNKDTISFIEELLTKLTPDEYLNCICLLTGTEKPEIKKEDFMDIITNFTIGLQINNILSLCELVKKVGLV